MSATQPSGDGSVTSLGRRVARVFPRSMYGKVIAVVLVLKAAILIVNASSYRSNRQYDFYHHIWRARSAGLEMGKMAYNSPLYYLPLLPFVDLSRFYVGLKPVLGLKGSNEERRKDERLLDGLRWLNAGYVMGGYLIWICGIFPRLASSRRTWLLASLMLLALPGVQKAAVMAHPDVLLFFLAPLTFYLTIRWLPEPSRFGRHLTLAVLAGLTGACRPFAIVPMLLCWALNVAMLVRPVLEQLRAGAAQRVARLARLGGKLAAVSLVTASLCTAWWAFRYAQTGELMNAYSDKYIARYQPLRADFDFRHYYSSLYWKEILSVPSRADVGSEPSHARTKNNSFWTLLYSETWGDHLLFFSGSKNGVESKLWVKRLLFVAALPATLLLGLGVVTGSVRAVLSAVRRRVLLDPTLFMAATFWLGFALFMYWQATAGLLPGKNSTVKFMYISWLVPFGIGAAASQRLGAAWFWVVLACEVSALLFAFPMALYWG
jgi:hypothetical protein